MAWVKYNVTDRRPYLSQVLEHVRLPLLSPKFLVGTVGSDLLIKSDEVSFNQICVFINSNDIIYSFNTRNG